MNKASQSIALVTGANDPAGLGFGIAEALLADGAIVYFGCRLDQQVRALAEPLKRFESRARALQLDVSDPVSIARAFALVGSESSRLDILVNNAGDGANCAALDETAEQWDRIMTANARGSFLCSQAAETAVVHALEAEFSRHGRKLKDVAFREARLAAERAVKGPLAHREPVAWSIAGGAGQPQCKGAGGECGGAGGLEKLAAVH